MHMFKRFIDFITLGSPRPLRRLIAYYAVLAIVVYLIHQFIPGADRLLSGVGTKQAAAVKGTRLLQDALNAVETSTFTPGAQNRYEHAMATILVFVSTLSLMLPVSWVYMSARRDRAHNQSVAQTLLVLPMIVAGVILIVRDSLALAFSLAGVVAAVRFRTSLADARDVVFIFLAIAVGFAAGTQVLSVAAIVSLMFNFVLIFIWQYDFGRNVLEPTAAAQWSQPLGELTGKDAQGAEVPDRDLMLALTPLKVEILTKRFKRVKSMVGENGHKPRYTSILSFATTKISEAEKHVEAVLDQFAKRWTLDECITNDGKASECFYLVRLKKDVTKDQFLTAVRQDGGELFESIDLEVGEALEREKIAAKVERKQREKDLVQ
jgi:Domain of unknown function (DUF4956)